MTMCFYKTDWLALLSLVICVLIATDSSNDQTSVLFIMDIMKDIVLGIRTDRVLTKCILYVCCM